MDSDKCPFCHPNENEIIARNALAYAKYDKFPVNRGHILIIPFRHFPFLFDATIDELTDLWDLINKSIIINETEHPDGYNIGVNIGRAAGQTVMHLHIHLIPRYIGDINDPRGGVRGVIPEKRIYD
ncbi:diadenosine tetraphosphate (Ap4A) HIT family hydrolase [Methanolinea mesophila]|uniref:HIT family protein n=1 Tax=Methanolinea mesophila TaxID=547055 RepID=UPI001AE56D54|nr:HIT domain-containing protein [Methanolinea mesophila]MBP1928938.1 diadenosine tetraphosphate (Ap4A) HIT family hydrolase [Methanolinea mesophila]